MFGIIFRVFFIDASNTGSQSNSVHIYRTIVSLDSRDIIFLVSTSFYEFYMFFSVSVWLTTAADHQCYCASVLDGHISVVISIVIALNVDDHEDCKLLLIYSLVCVCGTRSVITKVLVQKLQQKSLASLVLMFFVNPWTSVNDWNIKKKNGTGRKLSGNLIHVWRKSHINHKDLGLSRVIKHTHRFDIRCLWFFC